MTKVINRISSIRLWMMMLMFMATSSATFAALPSAKSSIDKMVTAMKKHPSYEIIFTIWNNGNSSSGSMTVAGKCFHISTPEIKIWYDGTTQWSYLHSAEEVNITRPTASELTQTNPLSILSTLNKQFTFRRLKAPAGQDRIELTPIKKNSDFSSAIIILNSATSLPKELVVKDAGGAQTTIKISSIKGGKTMPAAAFRFSPSTYPGVEIIDLR